METFSEGDRVRVDIPDEMDPDYGQYHGESGTIIDILEDDTKMLTGDERDARIFRVELALLKSSSSDISSPKRLVDETCGVTTEHPTSFG